MRQSWVLDEAAGRLVPAAEFYARKAALDGRCRTGSPMVITDLQPHEVCRSPVDGSVLGSRAAIREHNIRNDVESVGNDARYIHPRPRETKVEGSTAEVVRAVARGEIPVVPRESLPKTILPEPWES